MKGIEKVADFQSSDAIFDPPDAINEEERRMQARRTLGGGTLGSLLGAGAGYHINKNIGDSDKGKLRGIIGGGTMGGYLGATLGDAYGSYGILQKRDKEDRPLKRKGKIETAKRPEDRLKSLKDTMT